MSGLCSPAECCASVPPDGLEGEHTMTSQQVPGPDEPQPPSGPNQSLLLAFAMVALALMLFLPWPLQQAQEKNRHDIVEYLDPALSELFDIHRTFTEQAAAKRGYLLLPTAAFRLGYQRSREEEDYHIERLKQGLEEEPELQGKLDNFLADRERYLQFSDSIFTTESAMAGAVGRLLLQQELLSTAVGGLHDLRQAIEWRRSTLRESNTMLRRLEWAVQLILGLLAFAMAAVVIRLHIGARRAFANEHRLNESLKQQYREMEATEVNLRASQQLFEEMAANTRTAFCVTEYGKDEFLYVSPAYETIWGRSVQSLYDDGDSWTESIHPDDRVRVLAVVHGARDGEYTHKYRIVLPDGDVRVVWERCTAVRDEKGKPRRIVGVSEDITEEERLRESMEFLSSASGLLVSGRESEDLFRLIGEVAVPHVADCVLAFRWQEGTVGKVHVNAADPPEAQMWESYLEEYPPDPQAPTDLSTLLRADGPILLPEETDVYRAFAHGPEHEAALRRFGIKSGILMPVQVGGAVLGGFVLMSTRSGRRYDHGSLEVARELAKRIALALQNQALMRTAASAAARFNELAEGLRAVVWEAEYDSGLLMYVSPNVQDVTGFPQERWHEGLRLRERVHPDDRAEYLKTLSETKLGGPGSEVQCRIVAADGRMVWVRMFIAVAPATHNKPVTQRALMIDVTGTQEAERTLAESQRTLAALMANFPGMLYRRRGDIDMTIEQVGQGAESLTGRTASELVGQTPFAELIHPEDRDQFSRETCKALEVKAPFAHTYRLQPRSGEERWVWDYGKGVFDDEGRLHYVEGMLVDVTEQRMLQEQLRQAQKMEAVGRLAGGIAHDFNNILTVIRGQADLMLLLGLNELQRRERLTEIRDATDRAVGIIQQLLAFSRRQMITPTVLDLGEVVDDTRTMLRRLIGEDVNLVIMHAAGTKAVIADRSQIQQVLLNLAVNARDAMPQGGKLSISLRPAAQGEFGDADIPHGWTVLEVTDSGTGMDADTARRVFEPFFTTKQAKGTGLGLSTVYGIVTQSCGQVSVSSRIGYGTTFWIRLPAVEEPGAHRQPEAEQSPEGMRGSERILLVEDEAPVRALAQQVLEYHGYTVFSAATAHAALRISEALEFDLLITDVVMPGMSGRALSEVLLESRPAMRQLFMTGYTDDETLRRGFVAEEKNLLNKPFAPIDLLSAVRAVLDGTPKEARL
jgi:two-component system, cell cycle sensor histidine kinase and response regulator CckA